MQDFFIDVLSFNLEEIRYFKFKRRIMCLGIM